MFSTFVLAPEVGRCVLLASGPGHLFCRRAGYLKAVWRFVRHEVALEFVCGAEFSCRLNGKGGSVAILAQMAPRARADISPADFAEILLPFARQAKRCTLLTYDETPKTVDAKVDIPLIKQSHEYLELLHRMPPKLTFKRSTIRDGLMMLLRKVAATWKMDEAKYEPWVEVHTNRTMNLCRIVTQATQEKRSPPAWANELPWVADRTVDKEHPVKFHGLDVATKLPFRADPSKPEKKELGTWAEEQDESSTASAMAVWSDGETRAIASVTVGDLAEWTSTAASGSAGNGDHWSGEHKITKHKVAVRKRTDRKLLASVFEQKKQVDNKVCAEVGSLLNVCLTAEFAGNVRCLRPSPCSTNLDADVPDICTRFVCSQGVPSPGGDLREGGRARGG
jgi:hypothetical protein